MRELVPSEAAPYVPPGHPVPRFVAALVVVALALGVLAVVGPFRPQVAVTSVTWRSDGDRAVVLASITNDGMQAVTVTGLDGVGLREPPPLLGASGDAALAAGVEPGPALDGLRLDAGETRMLTTVVRPACSYYVGSGGPPIEVDVEIVLGLTRTVDAGGFQMGQIADTICGEGGEG
jgi:hypothetical protein